MQASRATRHHRFVLPLATLGLLAALFLLQTPQTRAQDLINPSMQGLHVNGTSLVIIFNELLDESSTPAPGDFTVDIGGTDYTPSGVSVRGAEVALTLSTAASMGDTVTLTYNRGTNRIKDLAGNEALAQTDQPVQNHTGATNSQPVFSTDAITVTVDENTASGTDFGAPVTATDTDTGDTLTHLFHSSGAAIFTVGADGQLATFASLDFESRSSYTLPLYVRDNKGPTGSGDSVYDDSIKVTINVNDVNEAPTIAGDAGHNVDENTTTVGTYTVTDPDPADTHTWSIETGDDGALFQIGQTSGVLSFFNAPDYETPASSTSSNTYTVTVKVTDSGSPPADRRL